MPTPIFNDMIISNSRRKSIFGNKKADAAGHQLDNLITNFPG